MNKVRLGGIAFGKAASLISLRKLRRDREEDLLNISIDPFWLFFFFFVQQHLYWYMGDHL